MRINVTKAVLLTIAGAALVFLPRRSSKQDSHIDTKVESLPKMTNAESGNGNPTKNQ